LISDLLRQRGLGVDGTSKDFDLALSLGPVSRFDGLGNGRQLQMRICVAGAVEQMFEPRASGNAFGQDEVGLALQVARVRRVSRALDSTSQERECGIPKNELCGFGQRRPGSGRALPEWGELSGIAPLGWAHFGPWGGSTPFRRRLWVRVIGSVVLWDWQLSATCQSEFWFTRPSYSIISPVTVCVRRVH